MNFSAGTWEAMEVSRSTIGGGVSVEAAAITAIFGQIFDLVVSDPDCAQRKAQSTKAHCASTKLPLAYAIRRQRNRCVGRSPKADEQGERRDNVCVRQPIMKEPQHGTS